MIQYRFLEGISTPVVYDAFVAAFADYELPLNLSREDFEYRLLRDGVSIPLSVGAFSNEELVGLWLNGPGLWQGRSTLYDAGTGVLPKFRGQGIAKEMFQFAIPRFNELGFKQYLLEVLTSNQAAIGLYNKLGFAEARRFAVFRLLTLNRNSKETEAEIRRVGDPDWERYRRFWTGYPSWQNSIEAAKRVPDTTVVLEARVDNQCVAYGAVSTVNGNLFQLAVDQQYRRQGIGSALLHNLQSHIPEDELIKVTNVDEQLSESIDFFTAVGFSRVIEQHEMILTTVV